jgi:hypothetical protein
VDLLVRQRASFVVESTQVTADEMTAALGMQPDLVQVRGSKAAEPPRPTFHQWVVQAAAVDADADTQVEELVERLEPLVERLTVLVARIRQDPNDYVTRQVHGGAVLSVVRHFAFSTGSDRCGIHLSERVVRFLSAVHACVDVDEYDECE